MRERCTIFVYAVLLLIFTTQLALPSKAAEPETEVYRIKKTADNIKIDGYLDEKAWESALLVPVNIEAAPGENIEAPVRTEALLLYDDSNFYVGFKAYDPEPHRIRAHIVDRDTPYSDELVAVIIDTFNDQNRAFAFFCNPLGVQIDEIFSDGGTKEDSSWDAIWDSAGHIHEGGFDVEMAIPFRSLQFQRSKPNQENPMWGIAFLRNYPRNQLHQIINLRHNRDNSCFLCQFPKLEGLEGASPGRNIELDPTITAFRTDKRENFPDSPLEKSVSKFEGGISGKWGLTPNLTLSATFNPDFSQVEADIAQLDINTQFALFYPEKRPFFLEGADFFSTQINGVYTRNLADPSWGLKLSGKEGKNAIGFFVARDKITNFLIPGAEGSDTASLDQGSAAAVLRYRRDIGSSSTLGFLITDREGKGYHNRLGGVDGLLRLTKSDTIRFQVLGTSSCYPDSIAKQYPQQRDLLKGYAAYLSYQRKAKRYGWKIIYDDFSPNFRSDLGFISQVNYRRGTIGGNYTRWGKKDEFISFFELRGDVNQTLDHKGNLLEREAEASVEIDLPLQSLVRMTAGTRKKVFHSVPFYQDFLDIFLNMNPSGQLLLSCAIAVGDEIDYDHTRAGKHFSIEPEATLNFGKHFQANLSYSYSYLNITEGRLFTARLLQSRLVYHFSKRAFLRGILQYTDLSRNVSLYSDEVEPQTKKLFTQFLFSYKINPRTVLFLGYSDNYLGFVDVNLKTKDRTFFLKIGYALSL